MPTRNFQRPAILAAALAITLFTCTAQAETSEPRGQWIGRTQVEGQRGADKTTLSLRAVGEDGAMLEVDVGRVCTLRDGAYSAQGDEAWSLRFKPTDGSSFCDRLSQGEFTLRAAGPRKLAFEARYPDGQGGQNLRNGVLARYP